MSHKPKENPRPSKPNPLNEGRDIKLPTPNTWELKSPIKKK